MRSVHRLAATILGLSLLILPDLQAEPPEVTCGDRQKPLNLSFPISTIENLERMQSEIVSKVGISKPAKPDPGPPPVVTVGGFTERDALSLDGDDYPGSRACSSKHLHGDHSNRWCHGAFVKVVDRTLQNVGVHRPLAALMSVLSLAPKEFLIDMKPSPADFVLADYEFLRFNRMKSNVNATVYGDGAFILKFDKQW